MNLKCIAVYISSFFVPIATTRVLGVVKGVLLAVLVLAFLLEVGKDENCEASAMEVLFVLAVILAAAEVAGHLVKKLVAP